MSKGPGKIERQVEAEVRSDPDGAWTIEDLAEICYPGETVEKKHTVSVLRAARSVAQRMPEIALGCTSGRKTLALYYQYNVMSAGLARLKSGNYGYRTERWYQPALTTVDLRAMLAPGGEWHCFVTSRGDADLIVNANLRDRDNPNAPPAAERPEKGIHEVMDAFHAAAGERALATALAAISKLNPDGLARVRAELDRLGA